MAHKATPMRFPRNRGIVLIVVAALAALLTAIIAGFVFSSASTSRKAIVEQETATLDGLRGKVLEFAAKNRRLPSDTEYQNLSAGFTDRLSRTPIYLVSNALASSDVCAMSTSPISVTECGSDPACASPSTILNVPFVLLLAGQAVVNASSIVSQTTSLTGTALVTTPTNLTRFAPSTLVGSQANRTQEIGVYDDYLAVGSFAELWNAAQCKATSQGDVVTRGTSVRILNTPGALPTALINAPYSTSATPFVAYGASGSTYSWSATGLPAGLTLAPLGAKAYLTGTPAVGSAGAYNVTVSVIATSPNGNTPNHSVTMTLAVCPFWATTGVTQTVSCPAGYSGAVVQAQTKETCTNTLQWVDQSNTCALISVATQVSLTPEQMGVAGVTSADLGFSSAPINGGTVTARDTSGASRSLSINQSGTGIGVVIPGANDYAVSGTEVLDFAFASPSTSASVVFSGLGRTGGPTSYESVDIVFTLGAAVVGTLTRTACSVNNDNENAIVAFDNLSPGTQYDGIRVAPRSGANFYVAGIAACTGATCQSSISATARCP